MTGHNTNYNSQDLNSATFAARVGRLKKTAEKLTQNIAIEQLALVASGDVGMAIEPLYEAGIVAEKDDKVRVVIDQELRAANLGLVALATSPESAGKARPGLIPTKQPPKREAPASLEAYITDRRINI